MKTIFVLWNIILVIISIETEMRICMALSNKKSYDLIKVSKHDHTCFTQGLSIDKNILYESCGLHRKSNVRKINYETGEILKIIKLDPALFAEGITVVDNYLYMLTYKEKRIYVIDLITFQIFGFLRIQTITGEGWGLAYDPHKQRLIVSDGSSHIIFYELPHYQYPHIEHDRQSLSSSIKPMIKYYGNIQRIHDIVVKNSYQHEIKLLNELEYVNGYLYANVWFQDFIVQIDLETGKMIQKYDFLSLYPLKDRLPKADYFNGIAYNKTSQTFLITGKLWPNYYEVKFVNRDVNARHDLM